MRNGYYLPGEKMLTNAEMQAIWDRVMAKHHDELARTDTREPNVSIIFRATAISALTAFTRAQQAVVSARDSRVC